MNRIIIIGNGFDKAHGLATGYMDFIDSYWTNVSNHIFDSYKRYLVKHWGVLHAPCAYEDEFVFFEVFQDNQHKTAESSSPQSCSSPYEEVRGLVSVFNDSRDTRYKGSVCLTFKNKFFEHIAKIGRAHVSTPVRRVLFRSFSDNYVPDGRGLLL